MNEPKNDFELIEYWKEKFKKSMEESVTLLLESDPSLDEQKIREEYILEKLATLMVGCQELGKEIRELKEKN